MAGIRHRLLNALNAVVLLAMFPALGVAAPRVALVIGNAAYAHAPALANPLNDAADIGAVLGRLGFAVTRLENVGDAEMRRGLKEFTRAASASEVAVVFYAGHGVEVDGRNFLVPVDARLSSDQDVEFEAVPLELVSRSVERASGFRLVILDACRENPFAVSMQRAGATRSIGRGLARVEPSGETLVAYAAKGGTVASDGAGRNSPYSEALLEHLEEPGLEVGLMFRKVRDAVLAKTGRRQEPFVYGSLSSRGVYLIPPTGTEHVAVVTAGSASGTSAGERESASDRVAAEQLAVKRLAVERELLFWTTIKDSDEPADFQAYLGRYPGGEYEALARNRLKRLEGASEKRVLSKPAGSDAVSVPIPEPHEATTSPAPSTSSPETIESTLGLERSERRRIQQRLASLGFDAGPSDGLFGRRTRLAIQSYQREMGTPATGYLDAESAQVLLAVVTEAGTQASSHGAARAERVFWGTVKGSDDPDDLAAYLTAYPDGAYAADARRRRDELANLEDDAAFSHARSSGTAESYLEYMRTHPDGRHLDDARRLRAQAEAAERSERRWPAGKKFRDCEGCPELVVVPAGAFTMGSPGYEKGRYDDEGPVHRVLFERPFAVGAYEVTRGEFERFVAEAGHSPDACWKYDSRSKEWKRRGWNRWRNPGFRQTRRDPVVCVNHEDAQAYARWLAGKTGKAYRLLSESEWEYAARAGTTTPYHTGVTISTRDANFGREGRYKDRTAPAGNYPPNAFGLHDMHGNAWEWVEDCKNRNYVGAPGDGRAWLTGECSRRVLRGGSWWDETRHVRSAARWTPGSHGSGSATGFRVARALD